MKIIELYKAFIVMHVI